MNIDESRQNKHKVILLSVMIFCTGCASLTNRPYNKNFTESINEDPKGFDYNKPVPIGEKIFNSNKLEIFNIVKSILEYECYTFSVSDEINGTVITNWLGNRDGQTKWRVVITETKEGILVKANYWQHQPKDIFGAGKLFYGTVYKTFFSKVNKELNKSK